MSEQGSTVASSVSTHLAVSGNGFFVVRGRSDDATARDPYYYTRAGQFTPDADGYLQNAAGYYLQGWPVDSTGVVTANPTDLNAPRADPGLGHRGRRRGNSAPVAVGEPAILARSIHGGRDVYDAADSAEQHGVGRSDAGFPGSDPGL
jgi:flagellar hook-basal body protein